MKARPLNSRSTLFVTALFLATGAGAEDYVISTVAGGGPISGPAADAPFDLVGDIAMDAVGNLLFLTRYRILRLTASGQVGLLAGSGLDVVTGDGGPATAAGLGHTAYNIAVAPNGDVFVSEYRSNAVRRIDATTGIIDRYAGNGQRGSDGDGGPAIAASLDGVGGLATDAAGDLFIMTSCRVRRVDAATRIITTFASLCGGTMATDRAGNLFVAQPGGGGGPHGPPPTGGKVSRVDHATGAVAIVAGNGVYGTGGDGGPATQASLIGPVGIAVNPRGDLYLSDLGRVRRVDVATGIIETVAGGTCGADLEPGDGGPAALACLPAPTGLATDASGNLFIADTRHLRIRRVDASTGIISTIAGNGTRAFGGDGRPALEATFDRETGVAVDSGGNLFIADTFNHRVRRVDAATGIIATVAGGGQPVDQMGDGGPATSAQLHYPAGLAFDRGGSLYIGSGGGILFGTVRRVDAGTGIITTVAGKNQPTEVVGDGGPATNARIDSPMSVAFDAAQNLYIAQGSVDGSVDHRVRRVGAATGTIATVYPEGAGSAPDYQTGYTSVAVDVSGNVFVADRWTHRVLRLDTHDGRVTTVAGTGVAGYSGDGGPARQANLSYPSGVAVDEAGNVFIADSYGLGAEGDGGGVSNQRVRRVDAATGLIATIVGNGLTGYSGDGGPATSATLAQPLGLAVDAGGRIFIADAGNRRVRMATPLRPFSVDDVSVVEGNTGTTNLEFSVTVSSPNPVSVDYATADGSAHAGVDYESASGTLSFPPGTTRRAVRVPARVNTTAGPHRAFFLDLRNPTGATIARSRGTGTILDDDTPLRFFTLPPCRLVDTREEPGSALGAQLTRTLLLTGRCGVPLSARVAALNLTVISASAAGDLRLYPGGTHAPLASTINYSARATRANSAAIALGANGEIAVRSDQPTGRVDLVMDVTGYFE